MNTDQQCWLPKMKYRLIELAKYTVWVSGTLNIGYNEEDISCLIGQILEGVLDYNSIIGWYRVIIFDKTNSNWCFFGDNANSQHLFYDEERKVFSDSLLELKARRKEGIAPNYCAVAQLLGQGYTVNEDTVISGIKRTDKECYYIFDGQTFLKKSKKLLNFSEYKDKQDLEKTCRIVLEQIGNHNKAAVCTGGTDSRAVISVLSFLNADVRYVLTAHEGNPDENIASRICKTLNQPLSIIDPQTKEEDWIKEGFEFTDGEYDAVLSYRHLLKAKWEKQEGIDYEFGGLAGEFYKNDFCHPFLWMFERKDKNFYYRALLKTQLSNQLWVGRQCVLAESNNRKNLLKVADRVEKEKTLLEKGNHVGYDILSWKSGAITNGYSSICTKVDPLMDRQLCAATSHDNCLTHAMFRWQRKVVYKYCEQLASIPTDQGYSCSLLPVPYIVDCIKKLCFYTDRVFNRLRRKMGLGFKSVERHNWDSDYIEARKTELWKKAIDTCKKLNILSTDATEDSIPLTKTGWILTLGMMFKE